MKNKNTFLQSSEYHCFFCHQDFKQAEHACIASSHISTKSSPCSPTCRRFYKPQKEETGACKNGKHRGTENACEDWEKEEWGAWKIVSDMLDHPDKDSIYPTSKCYKELYNFVIAQKAKAKKEGNEK